MLFASKMDQLQSGIFLELENKRKEMVRSGREVINLSVGTPDFAPPQHVMDALREAAADPENYKYSLADMPALTEAVIGWYRRRYGVPLEKDEVLSVFGSQEGLAHIPLCICDPGDTVLVPDPGYPIFSIGPFLSGAETVPMPLLAENGYLVDFEAIPPQVADRARLMVVSYPNNPVTAVADYAFYERLVAFAKKHDIIVVHDNAYSELVMDGEPSLSFLTVPGAKDVGVEFNSLSKSHNLTGCRISFALGSRKVIEKFRVLKSQIDYGMFLPIQYAAVAALTGPQDVVMQNRAGYRKRRDALCKGLRGIGWQVEDAPATMFVWAKLPGGYTHSFSFAMELLEKSGVLCVPGESFGRLGEGYVRFALVSPIPIMERAVANIAASGMIR
jgi:LL-diaminopimelate aminotransferase